MSGNSLAMMPWFPRDFIAATRHLALAERGAYRELLDYQWEMGGLPADIVRLARLLGLTGQEFEPIWQAIRDKFEESEGVLVNKRLEEHRKKAIDQRDRKIAGASKTNAKRYGAQADTESLSDTLNDAHSVSPPSPSPSPSPIKPKNKTPSRPPEGADRVFDHWKAVWGHPGATLDAKRRKRIEARLDDFTVEQLCDAISGFRNSPWHRGTDPKSDGTVYDSINTLLRDAAQVEQGLRLLTHPPRGPPRPETASERILKGLNGSDNSRVIEHESERQQLPTIARQ